VGSVLSGCLLILYEYIKVKKQKKKIVSSKKKKQKNIEHDFLFGKWKDFDIDARKLREELWTRKFD
jgi:hypothetical protein